MELLWKTHGNPMQQKYTYVTENRGSRVINRYVLPTMTYGSETWSTTKYLESKLQSAQRAMERQMLKLSL